MRTTYIVTGRHRTGTSMMMRCIDMSSDLVAVVDANADAVMANQHASDDYHPNPNGYYLPNPQLLAHDVPGKLIKVSTRIFHWTRLQPGQYRVVWMVRDERERLASIERSFGEPELPDYENYYRQNEEHLSSRPDVSFTKINYADVIANPLSEFQRLVMAGWPIDPTVAASFVDPSLYRNRG